MTTQRRETTGNRISFTLLAALLFAATVIGAAGAESGQPPEDPGWPRVFENAGQRVVIHQPQVDEWKEFQKLSARSAIAVTAGPGEEPAYGVVSLEATTLVDHESRTVLIKDPETEIRFPNVDPQRAAVLEAITRAPLPNRQSMTVSLDRMLAAVEDSRMAQKEVAVNLEPPPIFYSDRPALLVVFIGDPEFKPIQGTGLMAAVNTNWAVLFDSAAARYYMLAGDSWLAAPDVVKGPWTAAAAPADAAKLPDDGNWDDIRKAVPGAPAGEAPAVFVSTQPAELVLTRGEPKYSPVSGTPLMYVTNTDSPLFLLPQEGNHYLTIAGRWFRAPELTGPWTAATRDLPPEFAKIPEDHPLAYVRTSVPNTEEAEDAVLLASVPVTATIKRDTPLDVEYQGEPRFEPIEGTTASYATNTPNQVFVIDGKYYCCENAVWFTSANAGGPWAVATSVPDELYKIPPSHPAHNVTYVNVYNSTPTTVTTGYTSGYQGEYVASGLLVFGAGMLLGKAIWDDDDDHHHHPYPYYPPPPYYYGYGYGARYDPYHGAYYRGGSAYGPYGSAGRAAYYNPSTGAWARGGYRATPHGGAFAREGYNPATDTYGARIGASNPYGSWGRSYVERDDEWARGGHKSTGKGSVGWVETSRGSGGVAVDGPRRQGAVAKDDEGNVFVGKDGNIYKRDESGSWQKREDGGWHSVDHATTARTTTGQRATTTTGKQAAQRPASNRAAASSATTQQRAASGSRPSTGTAPSQPRNRAQTTTSRPSAPPRNTRETSAYLDRQASARSRGNRNAARYSSGGRRSRR